MSEKSILLLIVAWAPPAEWVAALEKAHPDLEVVAAAIGHYQLELPESVTPEMWKRVKILFTWKSFPTKELAPNLEYVQLLSAGCNQIQDLPMFHEGKVAFCTANGVHPPQITEWVFATFLAFQHHIPEHLDNQKIKNWVDPLSDEDTEDAVGLRVGILGYGCIGRQCARVAKAFGMDVYAYTLHERSTPEARADDSFTEPGLGDPKGEFPSKWFSGRDSLDEFFGSGLDLLVITMPLTDATRGMISTKQFELLGKKKAYVSNVGRGPIIDSAALKVALDNGIIRGAALDVTDPEPLTADHFLWDCKNLIITPHCSGNSNHYNERALKILAYNVQRRSEGKPEVNRVNLKLGY